MTSVDEPTRSWRVAIAARKVIRAKIAEARSLTKPESDKPYAYDEDRLIDACARGRRRYDGFV
jgi:hypothetical protein